MKVLLKENIDRLGRVGDIVEVADGYGRNYLIPYRKAVLPTEENIRQIEKEKEKMLAKLAKEKEEFEALASKLEDTSITITMKASEEGHLYGSVTSQIISEFLMEEGLNVPSKWIQLDEPIKEIGVYNVLFKMPHEIHVETKVWVVSDTED